jgi:hypothetical protein
MSVRRVLIERKHQPRTLRLDNSSELEPRISRVDEDGIVARIHHRVDRERREALETAIADIQESLNFIEANLPGDHRRQLKVARYYAVAALRELLS